MRLHNNSTGTEPESRGAKIRADRIVKINW